MALSGFTSDPQRLMAGEMLGALTTVFVASAIKQKSAPSSNQVIGIMLTYGALAGALMVSPDRLGRFWSIIGGLVLVTILLNAFSKTAPATGVLSEAEQKLQSIAEKNPTAARIFGHTPPGGATNG